MTLLALDSSVVVALLLRNHRHHAEVSSWWRGRDGALAEHALAESYSVLTRLPEPLRAAPDEVAHALATRFAPPLILKPATARAVPDILAERGVSGGAVYDGLVALAALDHDCPLATRDNRARGTYEALGVEVVIAA